jgi:hypothetical protein
VGVEVARVSQREVTDVKNLRGLFLAGALTVMLSVGIVAGACSDDDEDDGGNGTQPTATEQMDEGQPTEQTDGDQPTEEMADETPTATE